MGTIKTKRHQNSTLGMAVAASVTVAAVMLCLFRLRGYAPFGTNSLACLDANVDYLDFFAYLKDVLAGRNSGIYSFSKGLGGNMLAVLSSGYSSPLNFLVLFFEKKDMHSFFDLIVVIKMALAAATMTIYLKIRFHDRIRDALVFILALSYAFCQYNIAQASNVFWLEGVYTLPLFLLGVYFIIYFYQPYVLIGAVAYCVFGNWYAAAINCIFTVAWAVFELCWSSTEFRLTVKGAVKRILLCTFAGITGVLLSGLILMPTIVGLGKGNEGTLNFELFAGSNIFTGNIITAFTNYTLGAVSNTTQVALFSGTLVLLGCGMLFLNNNFSRKQKAIAAGLLGFTLLCFYWKPLFLVFSLFKIANSFWFRYSYIGVFTLIFLAALNYSNFDKSEAAEKKLIRLSIGFMIGMLFAYLNIPVLQLKNVYSTVVSIGISAYVLWICFYREQVSRKRYKSVILMCWPLLELCLSVVLLMNAYHYTAVYDYKDYNTQGAKQIETIKQLDNGNYRITQTKTRGTTEENLTATYDEPAQFNYWSLSAYTSSPDDVQRTFLDKAGYRMNEEDLYVVNTTILPIDSLLGVKYILSGYDVNGLQSIDSIEKLNDKNTYLNPFAFPMAFTNQHYKKDDSTDAVNPFEYQNWLFSELTGEKTEVFIPVKFEKTERKKQITYKLSIPQGEYAVYGNLPWENETNERIYANDEFLTAYAKWLSPSVFYIPTKGTDVEVRVESDSRVSVIREEFYLADLQLLRKIAGQYQSEIPEESLIENGKAHFYVNSEGQEDLVVSVCYDPDWHITRNGEAIEPELLGDCLMMIPLMNGENDISMVYKPSGVKSGIVVSLLGVIVLAVYSGIFYRNIRRKRKKMDF